MFNIRPVTWLEVKSLNPTLSMVYTSVVQILSYVYGPYMITRLPTQLLGTSPGFFDYQSMLMGL